jgi:hypothetical protein
MIVFFLKFYESIFLIAEGTGEHLAGLMTDVCLISSALEVLLINNLNLIYFWMVEAYHSLLHGDNQLLFSFQ